MLRIQKLSGDSQNDLAPGRKRKTYVYVIGAADNASPVKIGVSVQPKVRLRELQTANAHKLTVLAKFIGDEATETAVHHLLDPYRLKGEWFKRSAAVCRFIEDVRRGMSLDGMVIKHAPEPNSWDETVIELEARARAKRAAWKRDHPGEEYPEHVYILTKHGWISYGRDLDDEAAR